MKAIYRGKLAYFEEPATPEYWDRHWRSLGPDLATGVRLGLPSHIRDAVRRWLPPGSRCLEAGCGLGNVVYGLSRAGWPCVGLDYAEKTVKALQALVLGLEVHLGDVRAIPFPDASFDCYISQGVIEHFAEGYQPILREMDRILRPEGVALISFPSLSRLRKWKRRLRCYPAVSEARYPEFYQFALDSRDVRTDLEEMGYQLLEVQHYEGVLGVADEMFSPVNRLLLWLYNERGSRLASGCRRLLEPALAWWAGYCTQLVMRKGSPTR